MRGELLISGLLGLALVAAAGRVTLAWLPAGRPGAHRPARLLETWAASHVLGLIALHSSLVVASACDLRWSYASLGGLIAAAAAVHWASGPGNMVPRRDPTPTRATLGAALVLTAVALLTLVPIFTTSAGAVPGRFVSLEAWSASAPWQDAPFRLLAPASRVALVVVLLHGLESAGLRPLVRRAGMLLALAIPYSWSAPGVWSNALLPALLISAGCAFTSAWLRRADPRAGTLAALAFTACPAFERATWPLAALGLLVLISATHRNARRSVMKACAVGLLLGAPAFATWALDLSWARS